MNKYQETLYQIIENNKFETLPDQELIDTDKRVAQAIWKNYKEIDTSDNDDYEDRFYDKTRYLSRYEINFKRILHKYITDIEFWKDLNLENLILDKLFRENFNELFNLFCSKKENLEIGYSKTESYFYIEQLELLKGDNLLLKSLKEKHIVNKWYEVKNNEKAIAFIKDSKNINFLINLTKKNHACYQLINDEMKKHPDLIDIIVKANMFFELSIDLQKEKYLLFNFSNYTLNQLLQIDNDLLEILENKQTQYKIDVLLNKKMINNENFESLIKTEKDLTKILNSNIKKEYEEKIKEKLKIWVDNFSFKTVNEIESKLIKSAKEYNLNLDTIDFKITKIISDGNRINKEIFFEYVEYLFKKLENKEINQEFCENKLIALKKILPIEILKEWKLKDHEMFSIFFKKTLEKDITNETKKTRIKI